MASLDVGGLLDDTTAGLLKLIPMAIEFPLGFAAKGNLHQIARVQAGTLAANGICLSNMAANAPDTMKDAIANLAKNIVRLLKHTHTRTPYPIPSHTAPITRGARFTCALSHARR